MSTFLAHLAEAGSRAVLTEDGIVDTLVELVEKGQRAWPTVALKPERFVAHVAGVLPTDEPELKTILMTLQAGDLFLACACADGVVEATVAFRERMHATIRDCAGRADSDAHFLEAVEASVLRSLLVTVDGQQAPRIATYSGRCPLAAWVAVAAERTTLTVAQHQNASEASEASAASADHPQVAMLSPSVLADEDSGLAYLRSFYKEEFERAFAHAFDALTEREQALLRLHLGASVEVEVIARMYRAAPATVARWISDARACLAEESEARLKHQLQGSAVEFDSVARVLPTQIEARMTQLLYGPARRPSDVPR